MLTWNMLLHQLSHIQSAKTLQPRAYLVADVLKEDVERHREVPHKVLVGGQADLICTASSRLWYASILCFSQAGEKGAGVNEHTLPALTLETRQML